MNSCSLGLQIASKDGSAEYPKDYVNNLHCLDCKVKLLDMHFGTI